MPSPLHRVARREISSSVSSDSSSSPSWWRCGRWVAGVQHVVSRVRRTFAFNGRNVGHVSHRWLQAYHAQQRRTRDWKVVLSERDAQE